MRTIRHISGDQNEIELTDGKKYVAVESDGGCSGCGFRADGPCDLVPCSPHTMFLPREDSKNVIFKEKVSEDHKG